MFHLRPVAAENEDFLYRAYPKDWTIARKPKLGPPKARSNAEKRRERPLRVRVFKHGWLLKSARQSIFCLLGSSVANEREVLRRG